MLDSILVYTALGTIKTNFWAKKWSIQKAIMGRRVASDSAEGAF